MSAKKNRKIKDRHKMMKITVVLADWCHFFFFFKLAENWYILVHPASILMKDQTVLLFFLETFQVFCKPT